MDGFLYGCLWYILVFFQHFPFNQSINQSMNQSMNQSIHQSINPLKSVAPRFVGAFPAIASTSEQLTAPVSGTLDSLAQSNAEPGLPESHRKAIGKPWGSGMGSESEVKLSTIH